MIDFSFKNGLIKNFFEGDDSYIPASELIYLHEHPLIKNSFLNELEIMINRTSDVLIKKNMTGVIVQKFINSTISIGEQLPKINRNNVETILIELRKIYNLCKSLLK